MGQLFIPSSGHTECEGAFTKSKEAFKLTLTLFRRKSYAVEDSSNKRPTLNDLDTKSRARSVMESHGKVNFTSNPAEVFNCWKRTKTNEKEPEDGPF